MTQLPSAEDFCGRFVNGRGEWQRVDGRTLKNVQDAEVGG
jgi:hypothetical protein